MQDFRWPRRPRRLVHGGVAGLVAGVAFASLLQATGQMLPIARLVDASQLGAAWFVHLFVATVFGAVFGLAVVTRAPSRAIAYGLGWGFVIWAVAWMGAMRIWLGMPLAFDMLARVGLAGHIIYGFVLGVVYLGLRSATREARFHRLAY